MRALIPILLLSACGPSGNLGGDPTPPEATDPSEVQLETDDGLTLGATWWIAPGAARGPGALLLHEVSDGAGEDHGRSDWDPVLEDLVNAGVSALAIDFRSHGVSDDAPVPQVNLASDREQLPFDVKAGLDFLDRQGQIVDPAHVGVIGLGLGASLSLVAVHETYNDFAPHWTAASAVAISPSADRAADLNRDGTPLDNMALEEVMVIAAADHAADAADATLIHDEVRGTARLELIPASEAHGAALLAGESSVADHVIAWFTDIWTPEDER